ncbi:ORF5 [Halorubrum pleomorphic virus 3]|uniref:ORF5 n=1 Tax=Halorubrum pleomorphic virus 3 TaxID=1156720 RepID=H9ABN4_9VIRU|nr:ORF5 [Halorubrum pleomorphic virus 3]AFD04004.1 ORF5 [Halorubrum pleomorphic virus 3]
MTDDNDVYTPAQYREHQDGHGVRDPDAHPHAGIVRDEEVSRYLSVLSSEYGHGQGHFRDADRLPGRADELKEVERIREIAATETARSALDAGDMPSLKHLTGDQQERADISGMKAIQKIDEIITSPAPVIVILGEMGTGKTDLSGLFGQRAKHLLGVEQVASNIPSLKETTKWVDSEGEVRSGFVGNFGTMDEWVRQDGDPMENPQGPKLFIGDEFSSVGDGGGKAGYLMRKKMGPLVFKIRKFNGTLIYVAHDESSIHPLLWRVGVIVKKTSKKQAIVADSIKNGEIRDERFRIDGIPQTDWRYDTKDPAVWSWADSEEEETPEPGSVAYDVAVWTVVRCKKDGLTNRETAKFVPYSHGWVGTRWREYEQDGKHRDTISNVEAITA